MKKILIFFSFIMILVILSFCIFNIFNIFNICKKEKYELKQTKFKEALEDMSDILDANGLTYFLSCGTALGCHRERNFIEHDEDIDLGMFSKCFKQLVKKRNYILNNKFRIENTFPFYEKNDSKITEISFRHIKTNVKIDIFLYEKVNGDYYKNYSYTGPCDHKSNKRCEFLNKINLIEMNFLGRKYNVPNVDFLVSSYGKDWKTPKRYNYVSGILYHSNGLVN